MTVFRSALVKQRDSPGVMSGPDLRAAGNDNRPDAPLLNYAYDDARRLIAVSNPANHKISHAYDPMGNRTQTEVRSAVDTVTATQSQTFDELGRLLRELGAGAQTTTHAYDKADNRISTSDPRGKLYGFAFDALNRLTSETDPALAQIAYSNDPADNLTGVTDPRGLATAYMHNGWGEVIRETSPDRGITDTVFDARGLVTQQTADARRLRVVRDLPGAGVPKTHFIYDADGQLLAEHDGTSGAVLREVIWLPASPDAAAAFQGESNDGF